MGLGLTLFEEMNFEDGRLLNSGILGIPAANGS